MRLYALNYDNDYVDHDFKNRLTLSRYTRAYFLTRNLKMKRLFFRKMELQAY